MLMNLLPKQKRQSKLQVNSKTNIYPWLQLRGTEIISKECDNPGQNLYFGIMQALGVIEHYTNKCI